MKIGFNIDFGFKRKYELVERDNEGGFFYQTLSNIFKGGKFKSYQHKVDVVLNNPATLMVISLNCDLFSMGKINSYKNEEIDKLNVLYEYRKKPNEFQTWKQFLWDYMFWNQLGEAFLYTPSNTLNNPMYWLNPSRLEFSKAIKKKLSYMPINNISIGNEKVKYTFENGETRDIPLKEITPFFDLSNGISGNWYQGNSKIDALYQVIMNSERGLTAKYGNLDFSDKFVINGDYSTKDLGSFNTQSDAEKQDIERKVTGNKKVHSVKVPIKIERFTNNLAQLKLDESFLNDYFIIGKMFNIPRDVLESKLQGGATFENQEKSLSRHIEQGLKPKGEDLTDAFETLFEFEDLRISWNHLNFNQVIEKEREEKKTVQLNNLKLENEIVPMNATELKTRIDEINNQ